MSPCNHFFSFRGYMILKANTTRALFTRIFKNEFPFFSKK